MALSKRTYVGGTTKITAANLNDIQDSIIALEGKGLTKEEVVDALEYTPAKASDIPTTDISANTAARHSHSNKDVLDNIAEITSISGGAVTGGANALVTKEVLDATSQLITDEIPSELKNPYALTFTGASSGTYDGSSAVTINIPTGGGSSATGNELQYKGEWISSGNYQANDVVIDGSGKFYLYTGSSNGDPPDLDWENAKPFTNETGSIAPGEAGFVCSGAIYEVFKYLLNTTTSDTGKFLRVNSAGKPAWESVPSGGGVNF